MNGVFRGVAVPAPGVLLGPVACDRGSDGLTAPTVADATVPRAAAFRVVYRVDDTAGPTPLVLTDVIQVAQPWNSRLEHRDGPPPGGAVLSREPASGREHPGLRARHRPRHQALALAVAGALRI